MGTLIIITWNIASIILRNEISFIDLDSNYIEIFIRLSNSLRCDTKNISDNKKIIKLISSIKNCASKYTIKKMKKEPTEWENTFANHVSVNELESRLYEELLQINRKKIICPTYKWTRIGIDFSPKNIYK